MNSKNHGGLRIGAGRKVANPEEGPTRTIGVTVPQSLVDAIDGYCDDVGVSRSSAITEAIRSFTRKRGKRNARSRATD